MFRLMFTGAFLILGADGVHPHNHVNESMFWTDFLAMVGAFGCSISSALTLVVRPQSLQAPVLAAHDFDTTLQIFFPRSAATEYMASKSKQMATSITGQTMELREEPRHFITSYQSSMYPTKAMTFASDDDAPPAYANDLLPRAHDQYSRTHMPRDSSWRNPNTIRSVYSPPPSRNRDYNPHDPTAAVAEVPLRPNRRADPEFGGEGLSPASQVPLPAAANNRPKRTKSSDKNSGKNWLKNFKSPIGGSHACLSTLCPLVC